MPLHHLLTALGADSLHLKMQSEDKMEPKIEFVGTGGAFDTGLVNSSALLTIGGKCYLIDCGHSVFPSLQRRNLLERIDGVLVTHMHDDHIGSLGSLVYYYGIVMRRGKLPIYAASEILADELRAYLGLTVRFVDSFVIIRPLAELPEAGSIDTTGRHMAGMPTYGFYFKGNKSSIVYSGDNGDANYLLETVESLALPSPTIFHDVFFYEKISAHAHYKDLEAWQHRFPIFGYHCDHRSLPGDLRLPLVALQPAYCFPA